MLGHASIGSARGRILRPPALTEVPLQSGRRAGTRCLCPCEGSPAQLSVPILAHGRTAAPASCHHADDQTTDTATFMRTLKLLMDWFRFGSSSSGHSTEMAKLAGAAMPRSSDRLRVWQATHGLWQGRRLMAECEPPTGARLSYASNVSWWIGGRCPIGAGFAESTTEHRAGLMTGHLLLWNEKRLWRAISTVANALSPHPTGGRGWLSDSQLWPSRGSAAGASGPRGRSMWILLLRRAPTRAGTSLVKGGLLGPRLLLGHGSTNEWMRLGCRTPPPPRLYHGGAARFFLEGSGRSPGAGLLRIHLPPPSRRSRPAPRFPTMAEPGLGGGGVRPELATNVDPALEESTDSRRHLASEGWPARIQTTVGACAPMNGGA